MNNLIRIAFIRMQQLNKVYFQSIYNRIKPATFTSKSKIEIEDLNKSKMKENEETKSTFDTLNEEPEKKNKKEEEKIVNLSFQ